MGGKPDKLGCKGKSKFNFFWIKCETTIPCIKKVESFDPPPLSLGNVISFWSEFTLIGGCIGGWNILPKRKSFNNKRFIRWYGGGGGTLLLLLSKSLNIYHNNQYLLDFIAQFEYACKVSKLIFAWCKCVVLDTILLDKSLNTWYNLR